MRHTIGFQAATALMLFAIVLASPSPARAQSTLADGDLFVGGLHTFDASRMITAGIIQHVRGSAVTVWCQSPEGPPDEHWSGPSDLLVDSAGRVVFLAGVLAPGFLGYPGTGLFRCSGPGTAAEKLAVFPHFEGATFSGFPYTGPRLWQGGFSASGLHLARHRNITIDDDVNSGRPGLATDDAYVLVIEREAGVPGGPSIQGLAETLRYQVATQRWERGPEVVQGAFSSNNTFPRSFVPVQRVDALYHAGNTYSGAGHVLGCENAPLRVQIVGHIGSFSFGASLSLFGGYRQVPRPDSADSTYPLVTDDVTIANRASRCPTPPPSGISASIPIVPGEVVIPLAGIMTIGYDEYGASGLVLTSNYAPLPRVLTNVSEGLINASPSDDNGERFQENGCAIWDSVKFSPVVDGMDFTQLASTPQGVVGTQRQGSLAFVTSPNGTVPIVSTLDGLEGAATGIAVWPPKISAGFGGTIIIRIDSPVDVLLTDWSGRKLGVENGQPVNDFGNDGFDSGAGTHPRFYAINSLAAGSYAVQSVGTGSGPFTVHVYTADLGKSIGEHISRTGVATSGSVAEHDFTLTAGGALSFNSAPPDTDTIAPTTTAIASPVSNVAGWNSSDVTVTLSAVDGTAGSGVESTSYTATGVQPGSATVAGDSASIAITTQGTTTLSYAARDKAGNVETARTLTVRIDKSAPIVVASATAPNASGWNNEDVSVTWSVTDAESGVESSTGCGAVTLTSETAATTVTCTATNRAGLTSTASINVKIDRTAPAINVVLPVADAEYLLRALAATSYACADATSGVASCIGAVANGAALPTATGGTFSFEIRSTDVAGNAATSTVLYAVRYAFSGFFAPLVNVPAVNVVNAGRTIPTKWRLMDAAGVPITDVASFVSLTSAPIACDAAPSATVSEEGSPAGETTVRYEAGSDQFVFNWNTDSAWTGCRGLQVHLADGSTHVAKLRMK